MPLMRDIVRILYVSEDDMLVGHGLILLVYDRTLAKSFDTFLFIAMSATVCAANTRLYCSLLINSRIFVFNERVTTFGTIH